MKLVEQLSSQIGDRTQEANRTVAALCLDNPALLDDVAEALRGKDAALLGDCCEVMTKVAEQQSELVLPYIDLLVPLLSHKTTRVRWEAMHAIALAAERMPENCNVLLPRLVEIIRTDKSTVVRDYAVDALGNFAKANEEAALLVYPALRDTLSLWEGKHAGRALAGLGNVARQVPEYVTEILQIAHDFADHGKPSVRKAAKALQKACK